MKIEEIEKLLAQATPGPWKYDWGNWEVEGPEPEREGICSFAAGTRVNGSCGMPEDGELIAISRNILPKLLAVAKAAMKIATKDPVDAPQTYTWDKMRELQKALAELERE